MKKFLRKTRLVYGVLKLLYGLTRLAAVIIDVVFNYTLLYVKEMGQQV